MSLAFFTEHSAPVSHGIIYQMIPDVDSLNFVEAIHQLQRHVYERPESKVCLHLSHVNYVQSAALGALLQLNDHLRSQGKHLGLANLSVSCQSAIEMSRLNYVLTVLAQDAEVQGFWSSPVPEAPQAANLPNQPRRNIHVQQCVMLPESVQRDQATWGKIFWLASPVQMPGSPCLMSHSLMEPGRGQTFHLHPGCAEIFYLLTGFLTLWLEDQQQALPTGSVVQIPQNTVHGLFNESGQTAELLSVYTPPLTTGEFAIDVSRDEPWASLRS